MSGDEIVDLEAWEVRAIFRLTERFEPPSVTLRRCGDGELRVYLNDEEREAVAAYDLVRTSNGTIGANIVRLAAA
jgi:UPF0288 family protein (methanogenesis marker protein 3)